MEPLREIRNRLLNGWQLSKLHTFEVAARHQSFALAAEELSLSPSAVSHRINQLEEELGIQLFVRSHRKGINARGETCLLGAKIVAGYPESGNSGYQKSGVIGNVNSVFPALYRPMLVGARIR